MKKSILLVIVCLSIHYLVQAQGKYFEIVSKRVNLPIRKYGGKLVPLNNQSHAILDYPGKTQAQIYEAVMSYLKKYPSLKLNRKYTTNDLIVYRDFSKIGDSTKCSADLVGFTMVYALPENGRVKIAFGLATTIYSSINHAVLQITPQDDIASINNIPFNEYYYVQPEDIHYMGGTSASLKEAYPESVFDEDGKVVNPTVKKVIEDYYDSYVIELKTFLDQYFKK